MAKKARRTQKRERHRTTQAATQAPQTVTKPSRRHFVRRFRSGAIAVAALGVGGWYVGSEVVASIDEADLSKIGNGTPTIVQIHDPGCPVCRALQTQTRAALAEFEDGQLQYAIANIRQTKGKRLAAKYKVAHVTLLLFDGRGTRRNTLTGPNDRSTLIRAFRQLLEYSVGDD